MMHQNKIVTTQLSLYFVKSRFFFFSDLFYELWHKNDLNLKAILLGMRTPSSKCVLPDKFSHERSIGQEIIK